MDRTRSPRCHLTMRCNMACSYCGLGLQRAKYDEIGCDAWLARIREFPADVALITGGEPTLHRDFAAIVRAATVEVGRVDIHSNFHEDWKFDLDDVAGRLLWRASCHAQTAPAAQAWIERVKAAGQRGHRIGVHGVCVPEEVLAVLREDQIRIDHQEFPASPLSGRVSCTMPITALGPDGLRYHCYTALVTRDPRGIVGDHASHVLICDHATACDAADAYHSIRVAIV